MNTYLIQGLLLGLAYVAPIGMQNLYVINTAIKRDKFKAYQVSSVIILFDILLALACFFGVGLLIKQFPVLKGVILLLGSVIVLYIGVSLINSSAELADDVEIEQSLVKIIATCFAVTWLNPQALIDGSLLLGGYHASVPDEMVKYFILGFCSASFLWFTGLTTVIVKVKTKLNNKIVKWINIVCGIIIIFFGLKLGYSFIQMIMN